MVMHIQIRVPEYKRGKSVDHEYVGRELHGYIKEHFNGQKIVVRGIDSQEHPGLNIDDLVGKIEEHGTDRYDPVMQGRGYEKQEGIDLFGIQCDVNDDPNVMQTLVRKFHEKNTENRNVPVKMNVYMIYDAEYLEQITQTKDGKHAIDQFRFKDALKKKEALKAIVTLYE